MKKKGFTLIELLAVIVILAVIALIATPAVLNIIEDSKKSAAEASARSIIETAKTNYIKNIMDNKTNSNIDLSKDTLKYDGEQAKKGNLTYDANGNVSGKMYISGYCVEVKNDGSITSSKTTEDKCDITLSQVTTYANGTAIYYNPETNTKCTSSAVASTTGTKTGCMKWYTFNDEGGDTVNLLLDHNVNSLSQTTDLKEYEKIISNITVSWNSDIKNSTRIIKNSEVAEITEYRNWNNNRYYLHDNTQTEYKGSEGTNKYAWLFDNTCACTAYGCNMTDKTECEFSDFGICGYWTSNDSDSIDWFIAYNGFLTNANDHGDLCGVGVRPVITVNKSVLK